MEIRFLHLSDLEFNQSTFLFLSLPYSVIAKIDLHQPGEDLQMNYISRWCSYHFFFFFFAVTCSDSCNDFVKKLLRGLTSIFLIFGNCQGFFPSLLVNLSQIRSLSIHLQSENVCVEIRTHAFVNGVQIFWSGFHAFTLHTSIILYLLMHRAYLWTFILMYYIFRKHDLVRCLPNNSGLTLSLTNISRENIHLR